MSSTTATNEQLVSLQSFVKKQCKNLPLKIIPNGLNDNNLRALVSKSVSDEQLEKIFNGRQPSKCMINNCGATSSDLQFVTLPSIDLSNNVYTLENAKFMCNKCASCCDMNQFFTAITSGGDSNISALVKHFLRVNELDVSDIQLAQEIYTSAYALRVTAGYMPLQIKHFDLSEKSLERSIEKMLKKN